MVVKDWKIKIQSDGRPAITFPKGRQEVVLLPEAGDIELSDEGLIFSISRRNLVRLLIKEVVWDGENVHVYFKTPDSVCGGDTTDSLSINTALTNVDMVKQHF